MNEAQWRETLATRKVLWRRQPSDKSRNPPHIDGGAKGHTDVYLDETRFWSIDDLSEQAGHDLHALYSDAYSKRYGHSVNICLAVDESFLIVAKRIADLEAEESDRTVSSISANDSRLADAINGQNVALCLPYIDEGVLIHIKTLIAAIRREGGTLSGDLFCLVHINDGCDVKKMLGHECQIHTLVTEKHQWSASSRCVLCRTGSQALVYSSATQSQFWPATSQKHTAPVAVRATHRSKSAFALNLSRGK